MQHRLSTKAKIVIALSVVLIVGLAVTLLFMLNRSNSPDTPVVTPDFQAVVPKDKTIEELEGWQKLTPPSGETIYVFADSIESVPVTISEQSLPDSFSKDPSGSVTQLAEAYSATETFEAEETKVYIGNSSKGPQSVIFTKNNLLILIKSERPISQDAWKTYINSLT